jgi:hypothetical protein
VSNDIIREYRDMEETLEGCVEVTSISNI